MNPEPNSRSDTIGIIAGQGDLPAEIARGISENGSQVYILGIKGEAGHDITQFPGKSLSYGQLGEVYDSLRQNGVTKILFVGGVRNRPDFSTFRLDFQTIKTLPKILSLLATGDNSLLSGVVTIFEDQGFEVVGVKEVAPEILTPEGVLAGKKPAKKSAKDIQLAFDACKQLGALDIGQAAIAEAGRVIAVEAAEGTDAMIDRVSALRRENRLSKSKTGGVLVKSLKPGQEMRADLPTIGPETVQKVIEAGLAGIALETGTTIIVKREETLRLATENGKFVIGVTGGSNG